jgi:hypothetical protein
MNSVTRATATAWLLSITFQESNDSLTTERASENGGYISPSNLGAERSFGFLDSACYGDDDPAVFNRRYGNRAIRKRDC